MQQCPFCDKVYDESEYSYCPYCSGELEDDDDEVRPCPECGGSLIAAAALRSSSMVIAISLILLIATFSFL